MYYTGNALYDFILEKGYKQFKFTTGNIWQLVYGDVHCNPKLLVLVSGVDKNQYVADFSENEKEALELLNIISSNSKIPLRIVRFLTDQTEVDEVITFKNGERPYTVTMKELKELFHQDGLPISDSSTGKYLNDATSSAYHNWQRSSLGRDLKVSDFDLWKIDENGMPIEVYELKRSFYSLDKWEPYPDDYNNFRLIFNVVERVGIKFKIVYNVRTKRKDDISTLKIFDVNFKNKPAIQYHSTVSLNDFLG
jgi:hypothetical protein